MADITLGMFPRNRASKIEAPQTLVCRWSAPVVARHNSDAPQLAIRSRLALFPTTRSRRATSSNFHRQSGLLLILKLFILLHN